MCCISRAVSMRSVYIIFYYIPIVLLIIIIKHQGLDFLFLDLFYLLAITGIRISSFWHLLRQRCQLGNNSVRHPNKDFFTENYCQGRRIHWLWLPVYDEYYEIVIHFSSYFAPLLS